MTLAELWLAARARWQIVVGVLVVVVLGLAVWINGRNQYARGREQATAVIADSIGKVYESHYQAFRDSTTKQIADFKIGLAQANARAASAEKIAADAQAERFRVLTPQVIAQTPPQVVALIARMDTALTTERASNRELTLKLDTATALIATERAALTLADTALAQKDREISYWRKIKEPPHGFWHTVGQIAKVGGALVGGILLGRTF